MKINFNVPLKIAVILSENRNCDTDNPYFIRSFLNDKDEINILTSDEFVASSHIDLALFCQICGPTPLSKVVAEKQVPSMAIEPYHAFHPYHAAFYRDIEKLNGILLPAFNPDEIASSIRAVRAKKALQNMTLVVADPCDNEFRLNNIKEFIKKCSERFNINIVLKSTDEIKEKAKQYNDETADNELVRWEKDIIDGPGEMNKDHMRQVAKLYLAQRDILEETGAIGITTHDIKGFLQATDGPEIMPNVTYGILVHDGYLACEEADIEVLTTELLLYAATGMQSTMSNIYLAYRDCYTELNNVNDYTNELELKDTMQSFKDNHVTAAHFSASGVLPGDMMEEERYKVRETIPSWQNQSMVVSTPKLGKVVLARLSEDCSVMHTVYGEVDSLGLGDQYGWYRGRWFIKIPDVYDFSTKCLHQHYAIGQDTGNHQILDILMKKLFKIQMTGDSDES